MKKILSVVALILMASASHACQFDTDCGVGSTCEKSGYGLYGVCQGGLNPGNAYDDQPVFNPLDLNRGFMSEDSDGDARSANRQVLVSFCSSANSLPVHTLQIFQQNRHYSTSGMAR